MVWFSSLKGLAKKEARMSASRISSEMEMKKETSVVTQILHHVKNNPEGIQKALDVIRQFIPQMDRTLKKLEKQRRITEQQVKGEARTMAQYEEFTLKKLLGYFPSKDAEELVNILFEEEKAILKGERLVLKNGKRLYKGKKPAGHFFKKHFASAKKLGKEEKRQQKHLPQMLQRETELKSAIQRDLSGMPDTRRRVKANLEELFHLWGRLFHTLFEFEWNIDEDEANVLEEGKFHLAALTKLQKQGTRGAGSLLSQLAPLLQKYSHKYLRKDIKHEKRLYNYLRRNEKVCAEGLKRVRIRKKKTSLLFRANPALRIIFDREFRRYVIKKAPRVAPVIVRAVLTEGASLTRPADLAVLIDFGLNDPSSPEILKKWGNKMLHSKQGKAAVKLLAGKVPAKAA